MAVERRPISQYSILRWVLLVIAVLLFLAAAFHVTLGGVDLVPLGLAFGFGAGIVP